MTVGGIISSAGPWTEVGSSMHALIHYSLLLIAIVRWQFFFKAPATVASLLTTMMDCTVS